MQIFLEISATAAYITNMNYLDAPRIQAERGYWWTSVPDAMLFQQVTFALVGMIDRRQSRRGRVARSVVRLCDPMSGRGHR
jgi:hypothetical protein